MSKKKKVGRPKLPKLPKRLVKLVKKAQRIRRAARKADPQRKSGIYSLKKLRSNLEKYGYQEAKRLAIEAVRYEQGYAYRENIKWMKNRLSDVLDKFVIDSPEYKEITKMINFLSRHGNEIMEEDVSLFHDIIYNVEKGHMLPQEGLKAFKITLKNSR